MEAELKTLEQMAAKAEQRARYILDGYLSSQKVEPEVVQQVVVEPVIPVNEIIRGDAPSAPADPPKPKKIILKSKKIALAV
ncbi:MAG: hypothetical protein EB127_18630 [Alphaproteobacteria bacterium]|nr:hypothetical protein [Alphaproteobacteria bacterium]